MFSVFGTYRQSGITLLLAFLFLLAFRFAYWQNNKLNGFNATTWDAFGYYLYLPGSFIYQDVKKFDWLPAMDQKYHLTGGELYQLCPIEKPGYGYTGKYLCGTAILQSPFFFMGHFAAQIVGAPADGFSWPYQYALLFGALISCFIGLWLLRKLLIRYFDDQSTALTLLFLVLCSNLVQYVSVDGAMSHAWIFPLYAALLLLTDNWYRKATVRSAFAIGLIIGLAVISRPTELLMIFIPLLWRSPGHETKAEKWKYIAANRLHILWAISGGIVALLPQLLYWKYSTGSWIYDVGSKWFFLNPWFRVLFGIEKGWFIYTPVAVLMLLGFFKMRHFPFKRAVITFCLLQIWVIIAWSDWKYGASYSTRALTQHYPVFALGLAAFLYAYQGYKRFWYGLLVLMLLLNVYQLLLYNNHHIENFTPFVFGFSGDI